MKISRPKRQFQMSLFDAPIGETDHGYARHVIGDTIEKISAIVLGGTRHQLDCSCDYCPDISVKKRDRNGLDFYECKAMGLSRQTFIYAGRLKKDRSFARRYTLNYLIWRHEVYTKDARSADELRTLLLQRMICGYIVPFEVIDSICSKLTEEKLNSKYGLGKQSEKSKKTYGSGFRFPESAIKEYRAIEWSIESCQTSRSVIM